MVRKVVLWPLDVVNEQYKRRFNSTQRTKLNFRALLAEDSLRQLEWTRV